MATGLLVNAGILEVQRHLQRVGLGDDDAQGRDSLSAAAPRAARPSHSRPILPETLEFNAPTTTSSRGTVADLRDVDQVLREVVGRRLSRELLPVPRELEDEGLPSSVRRQSDSTRTPGWARRGWGGGPRHKLRGVAPAKSRATRPRFAALKIEEGKASTLFVELSRSDQRLPPAPTKCAACAGISPGGRPAAPRGNAGSAQSSQTDR